MIILSDWIDGEHCSMRIVLGGNMENVADRVAFIEKTPRVRIAPHSSFDWKNWEQGSKGYTPDYQPSRDWCDKRLVELGYTIPGE